MSKAIQGAAMLAGAVAMGALAFADPALIASPLYDKMMFSLALGGIATEAGAIASALTSNRGQNITTRTPAAFRQIIYGNQRVGGVEVYRSTTGSHKDQFNYIIVIATHEIYAITGLYLDGRLVYWNAGSAGYTTYNNSNFGGSASGGSHTGPNGQSYDFGGKVYCEVRFGNQPAGDHMTSIQANDPTWAPSASGTPTLSGCTYVYLKLEHDSNLFPGEPEIRFSIKGKPVYDPRLGQKVYSHNPALIINDIITDPEFGLADNSVNEDQLIAAANICEEQVYSAGASGYEDRYACHWHYDTSLSPGDAIAQVMSTMGGRFSRVGGEWYIWPATYYGPTVSLGADDLLSAVQWSPNRSYAQLCNRVTGTYTAPNYPYNVAGDVYDTNGWYQGQTQNNFPFAFQPTNFPQYAADTLHGYAADEYLNADGGFQLPHELSLPGVLSVSQAQRLAKIYLLRNRQQGSGTLRMKLKAFQLQPCDTFYMTFAENGWENKTLEVNSVRFNVDSSANGTPQMYVELGVNETDPTVYAWSSTEELTVYDVPAAPMANTYTPAPPTNMQLLSTAATALAQPDGSVVPRIEVTWDTPLDVLVKQIQMQYQLSGASAWTDAGLVDVSLNAGYITPVVSGQTYNVRIRSLRSTQAASAWVEVDAFNATTVLSVSSQDAIGPGSLVGEAYTDGTAGIDCQSFTALLGGKSVTYFAGGQVMLTGLQQKQLYYVFVVDQALTGGNLTPVATLSKADYLGKLGYFLIDSIVTPYASSGGAGGGGGTPGTSQQYRPSSFQDIGSRTTQTPDSAYDGDNGTAASVSGNTFRSTTSYGDCIWQGDPNIALSTASTLTVNAAVTMSPGNDGSSAIITATVNGTAHTLLDASVSAAQTSYTFTVPANTPLSTISVEVAAYPAVNVDDSEPKPIGEPGETPPTNYLRSSVFVSVYDIFIQS